tara:strand:+ start:255 stop:728 length:474 start_codon:yes stop_codon:yes gene_type:complete
MTKRKVKIHLNKMAQEMLFGYFEGVDWQIDLCKPDPNDKSDNPRYILLPEKEQNRIHDKVLTWINNYRKKYNGKFSEMEVDSEMSFYLTSDSDNQASLIQSEVFEHDVEDLFEWYWCYKTNRERKRVIKGKEDLYDQYKLAYKQLNKLSKLTIKERT